MARLLLLVRLLRLAFVQEQGGGRRVQHAVLGVGLVLVVAAAGASTAALHHFGACRRIQRNQSVRCIVWVGVGANEGAMSRGVGAASTFNSHSTTCLACGRPHLGVGARPNPTSQPQHFHGTKSG